jgi:ABC-type dipeptide/oligopeptide/nickel transport system permease subunit
MRFPAALGPTPAYTMRHSSWRRTVECSAGLMLLGRGTQPRQPSWGVMLSESRLNSLADALRDRLDPRTPSRSN